MDDMEFVLSLITDEQRMLRDTVLDIIQRELKDLDHQRSGHGQAFRDRGGQ